VTNKGAVLCTGSNPVLTTKNKNMKGKLIKDNEGYYALYTNKGIFVSDVNGGSVANRLSNKNCEAIANGYDLDELAGEYANKELNVELTSKAGNFYGFSSSFKEGFQKALSILGDKKFSKNKLLVDFVYFLNDRHFNKYMVDTDEVDLYLESLQQTQWDVEIEMEENCPYDYTSRCTQGRCDCKKPKLDADGCLILKRK
jgi:hypothetical protein